MFKDRKSKMFLTIAIIFFIIWLYYFLVVALPITKECIIENQTLKQKVQDLENKICQNENNTQQHDKNPNNSLKQRNNQTQNNNQPPN